MTPKFIQLHRVTDSKTILDKTLWVNPRRVNSFYDAPRYTAHPDVRVGTIVNFGRETALVSETVEDVVRLLKK